MEILLIRHGDPDYENDTITELGHFEAKLLADQLMRGTLDAIYVSPMGRAQATMRYTADALGIEPVTLDWLSEVRASRVYERAPWEVPGIYVLANPILPDSCSWREEPLFGADFAPHHDCIAQGFDEVLRAHGYEKAGHLYRVVRGSDERIAFFCHKGTTLTLLSYLLHWPLPLLFPHCQISPTGVTRLLWRETDGWAVPQMLVMNDLSHLAEEGQG